MRAIRQVLSAKGSNWAICLLSVSLLALAVSTWTRPVQVSAQGAGAPARKPASTESRALLTAMQNAFADIADNVEPSVVTISARSAPSANKPTKPMQEPKDNSPMLPDPFDFFRRLPRPDGPDEGGGGEAKGSGVIVRQRDSTVYVLTNNHVVESRERLRITMLDKSEYTAELVGRDERTDLAVLKFNVKRALPEGSIATLGDSDKVRVGQWAIAIGSPLGYDSTLTVGVISAKGRELNGLGRGTTSYQDLIQTDASINPGNSGGPLMNIDGEVVGINVAIASSLGSQGNIGIGFAIPINAAKAISEQLIERGKVTRGYLGVGVSQDNRELSPELREHLRVPDGGALCENVNAGTPAARAGLQDGDVIVRFGDRQVRSFTDLEKAVSVTTPGTSVPVEVVRDGKPVRLNVTVQERPSEKDLLGKLGGDQPGAGQPGAGQPQAVKSKYGLSVRPGDGGKGVQIAAVTPGSPADDAGLRPGDVVMQVGSTSTGSVDAFQKAINAAPATQGIVLRVKTTSGLRFVVIKPE
jgi:serine protease Do